MKRIIGILCGLFFFLFSFAQETFQKETYISSRGDTLLYRLLRPEVMKPDEKYPWCFFCMVPESVAMIMRNNWFMVGRCGLIL